MTVLYLETSAVLGWLYGEPSARKVIHLVNRAETVVTSVLTLVEAQRSLVRARCQRLFPAGDERRLSGVLASAQASWNLMEITPEVRARAGEGFPVEPVRSLDAIHLATALEFLPVFPDLRVLSFDERILSNLEPLGIPSAI